MKKKATYNVHHDTHFSYSEPVSENIMILAVEPLENEYQQKKSFKLQVSNSPPVFQYRDCFENKRHYFNIPKRIKELSITSLSTLYVSEKEPPLPNKIHWEALVQLKEKGTHWHWFQPSFFARSSSTLASFIENHKIKKLSDPLASLIKLNQQLFSLFTYKTNTTHVHSPIEDILQTRCGVCQDYTHVMITIARLWGIPTRYVSGYFYQADKVNQHLPNETHAWLECFLPPFGWLGFDPTNNQLTNRSHIRVAVGRDYADVPPTKGFFKGIATSKLKVFVNVDKISG